MCMGSYNASPVIYEALLAWFTFSPLPEVVKSSHRLDDFGDLFNVSSTHRNIL